MPFNSIIVADHACKMPDTYIYIFATHYNTNKIPYTRARAQTLIQLGTIRINGPIWPICKTY